MKITKVFVNGSFDLLHVGHLQLLTHAKSLGDYLLVALDSDRRISEKKGKDRPINNQHNRCALMNALKPVDEIKVFDSDQELCDIIINYKPDIMMVGSDWRGKPVIGSQYAKSVVYFDRVDDESTTKTIQNYVTRRFMY